MNALKLMHVGTATSPDSPIRASEARSCQQWRLFTVRRTHFVEKQLSDSRDKQTCKRCLAMSGMESTIPWIFTEGSLRTKLPVSEDFAVKHTSQSKMWKLFEYHRILLNTCLEIRQLAWGPVKLSSDAWPDNVCNHSWTSNHAPSPKVHQQFKLW